MNVSHAEIPFQGEQVVASSFGDSVRLLEALRYIFDKAGTRPCVINISLGTNGGPHDGTTLVEQGIDSLLPGRPEPGRGDRRVELVRRWHPRGRHTARQGQPWTCPGSSRRPASDDRTGGLVRGGGPLRRRAARPERGAPRRRRPGARPDSRDPAARSWCSWPIG